MMTIQTYEPGPTEPEPERPKVFNPPRVSGIKTIPMGDEDVRRVLPADLDSLSQWVIPALQEKWWGDSLSENSAYKYLLMGINDLRRLLICTKYVVGYFETVQDYPSLNIDVKTKFVVAQPNAKYGDEGVNIYKFALEWADSIGAREFEFDWRTDIGLPNHVCPALFDLKKDRKVVKHSVYTVALPGRK